MEPLFIPIQPGFLQCSHSPEHSHTCFLFLFNQLCTFKQSSLSCSLWGSAFFTVGNTEHLFLVAFFLSLCFPALLSLSDPLTFSWPWFCLIIWIWIKNQLFFIHPTASVSCPKCHLVLTFSANSDPTVHIFIILPHINLTVRTWSQRAEKGSKSHKLPWPEKNVPVVAFLHATTNSFLMLFLMFSFLHLLFKGNISSAFTCFISHCSESTKKRPDHHTWYPVDVPVPLPMGFFFFFLSVRISSV